MSANLNPAASEFVPNFSMPNMSALSLDNSNQQEMPQQQQQMQQQDYYQNQPQTHNPNPNYHGQNYNQNHNRNNNFNPNYRGNNHNPNYRGNNHRGGRNNNNGGQRFYGQGGQSNGYQNNGYHYQQQHGYDVDPVELEARCEAVIEILGDDKIRDSLNPSHDPNNVEVNTWGDNNDNENPCDDEEEMFEMMAMQEECRLEMMKFYIQSQNPTLFEEIYHDVSYPDSAKNAAKVPEEELRSPKFMTSTQQQTQTREKEQQQRYCQPTVNNTLKDLIINSLNPNVNEFVPEKFANEPSSEAN
jgi:hypothetical protein